MKIFTSVPSENLYFQETTVEAGNAPERTEMGVINVFDEFEYQSILGFGGAFTESAAYNYAQLTDEQKKLFLESYFSREKGIGYNFGRTHINSCDFSLDVYAYIESGDKELKTFSIERDKKYIIPFIKDAMQYCQDELFLFASPWSPPAFMKDNESVFRGGSLKEEYKECWARYYAKYIKAMAEEGVTVLPYTEIQTGCLTDPAELDLLKKLSDLPAEVESAAKALEPARMTRYVMDLATAFHTFYAACRVKVEDRDLMNARLKLIDATRIVLKGVLTMLKVSAPEKM